jgi:hypothetical protein
MGKEEKENKEKLGILYEFYVNYHLNTGDVERICPFSGSTKYGLRSCKELCVVFFEDCLVDEVGFSSFSGAQCPCHKYGSEGAMARLKEVLLEGGYYV